ncbi:MAG: hypothetical protein M5U13_10670 [Thermoanaerobaculia bacterium]|nr:hypothetical protein [Thermoanaerobaculia bacterium]
MVVELDRNLGKRLENLSLGLGEDFGLFSFDIELEQICAVPFELVQEAPEADHPHLDLVDEFEGRCDSHVQAGGLWVRRSIEGTGPIPRSQRHSEHARPVVLEPRSEDRIGLHSNCLNRTEGRDLLEETATVRTCVDHTGPVAKTREPDRVPSNRSEACCLLRALQSAFKVSNQGPLRSAREGLGSTSLTPG